MKSLSPYHREQIACFVRTLRLRPHARAVYSGYLKDFRGFVHARSAGGHLTTALIRRWLKQQVRKHPLYLVHSRARVADQFLQWRQAGGARSNNPFEQLRTRYEVRAMSRIVNALLTENYAAALEKLRPPPRFGSFLGPQMQTDVARKRALGYRYNTEESAYLRFDRFLQTRPDLAGASLNELVQAWSRSGSGPSHILEAHACGRNLSKALHRLDPQVPLVPIDSQLRHRVISQFRKPHILDETEISRLFQAAQSFPSPRAPWRPLTLYTMVALTYCAGLRLGELARLRLGDVHLEDDSVEIHNTKFFKSRRLPLTPSVMRVLKQYLAARERAGAPLTRESGLFWSPRTHAAYSYVQIGAVLTALMRYAGLKPARGRRGPRVHDLRHAFVLNRMLVWYRNGTNPQAHLPYLATYLGHQDISSTLIYLTQTEELQRHANERFRQWRKQAVPLSGEPR